MSATDPGSRVSSVLTTIAPATPRRAASAMIAGTVEAGAVTTASSGTNGSAARDATDATPSISG